MLQVNLDRTQVWDRLLYAWRDWLYRDTGINQFFLYVKINDKFSQYNVMQNKWVKK